MSNRKYLLVLIENGQPSKMKFTAKQLLSNKGKFKGTEFFYTLQEPEQIDIILDLKEAESLFVKTNRDDENSKGVIFRV